MRAGDFHGIFVRIFDSLFLDPHQEPATRARSDKHTGDPSRMTRYPERSVDAYPLCMIRDRASSRILVQTRFNTPEHDHLL